MRFHFYLHILRVNFQTSFHSQMQFFLSLFSLSNAIFYASFPTCYDIKIFALFCQNRKFHDNMDMLFICHNNMDMLSKQKVSYGIFVYVVYAYGICVYVYG
ncbi:unnamed protein product [Ilex paraguariensis]|uniref:Uncharacterized protein n=1 Tax=Ilex paraguariensis TaxID=185542 RepID=A0ABC8UQS7_9AQUA